MTDIKVYGPVTPLSQELHAEKYRPTGESFRDAMLRIAGALQDYPEHFHTFKDILYAQRFLPAGRIQTSVGSLRRTTAFNCFLSGVIEDSMGSIMQRAAEAAETMRLGGGIGYDFSRLRPRGERIKSLDSKASGPISFMGIYDAICQTIASAGHRRGAQMAVLRVDHPDILEFIRAKRNDDKLQGFNISVGVTDEFMQCLEYKRGFDLRFDGKVYETVDPQYLWDEIMRSTWDWAEPGILFIDRINKSNNLYYCETIEATNPCFTGDTKVWTAEGQIPFAELAAKGDDVEVLTQTSDGRLVYRTMRNPRMTRQSQPLVKVTLDNGTEVRCTPDHQFFTKAGNKVEAQNLQVGERIESVYRYKANQKGYKRLTNGKHTPLEHHVPFEDLKELEQVHHINGVKHDNRRCNLERMSGKAHRQLHMSGDNNPGRRFPESMRRDVEGELNPRYRQDIDDAQLRQMRDDGMSFAAIAEAVDTSKYTVMKRLGWERPSNHRVVSVEHLSETEDVYCGTVDETSRFFVALGEDDGVLVSNCAEQPLPPFGACLLGSFNIAKYVANGRFDWSQFIADIPPVVRALDNVIDRTIYPLKEQETEAKQKRRMGIGVTGMANAIEAMGHPYGTDSYLQAQDEILRTLRDKCYSASVDLAIEKGPFPLYDERYLKSEFIGRLPIELQNRIKEHAIRNSHLTSIAPTGTISLTADNISSGIEPPFTLEYDRTIKTFDGERVERVHDYGAKFLGVKGLTADEIDAETHVNVLCRAQQWVDSSISKTCNVGSHVTYDEFKDLYLMGYKQGAKGLTTFRASGKRFGILNAVEAPAAEACYIDPDTGKKTCD